MPFLSTSVLRRYTPPTCTLEIVAKDSPLSRWAGRPLLRQLRFQLSFDDPRLPESEQVTLRGDRFQLDELSDAVSAYVQEFLQRSPALLYSALRSPSSNSEATVTATEPRDAESSYPSKTATLSVLNPDSRPLSEQPTELMDDSSLEPPAPLILQPPRIALEPQGLLSHKLKLGSLATEISGPAIVLSSIQLSDLATALDEYAADAVALPELNRVRALPTMPTWARTAAVMLLTAGLTTATVKLLDRPTPALKTAVSLSNPQVASQPSLRGGPTMNQPIGVPTPPLLSQQTLPPPPPAGAIASSKLPNVAVPGTAPSNPSISMTEPSALPPPVNIQPQEAPAAKEPPSISIEQAPVSLAPPPPQPQAVEPEAPAESSAAEPTAPDLPSVEAARMADAPAGANEAASAPAETETATAFDSIPQVAEVRSYFQERWQPPEGLSQTLEYSLLLSPDGSIQRIIPLGQSAGDYIDRTGMPLVGEAFVTPIQDGRSPRVRVVLSPDGEVRTFLEGS